MKHSILSLVGNTPLIQFYNISEFKKFRDEGTQVFFKLEYFNPLQSVKDRIALNMITEAEKAGVLKKGMQVIEPTSGNTGIGLAFVCASKGYPLTLVMPETMSVERRILLIMLGAKVVLTPGPFGMKGAIAKANQLARSNPNVFMPKQFENPSNPDIHYRTTGPEIWRDTGGVVDVFISGVGTGGTLTGVSKFLREKNQNLHTVAVEPDESPVLSGGAPSPHKIQGIGAGFIPKNLDRSFVSSIERVASQDALKQAQRVIANEGVPIGISSGAIVEAAIRTASNPAFKGKTIVALLASATERYLSTLLAEDAKTLAVKLPTEVMTDEDLKSF